MQVQNSRAGGKARPLRATPDAGGVGPAVPTGQERLRVRDGPEGEGQGAALDPLGPRPQTPIRKKVHHVWRYDLNGSGPGARGPSGVQGQSPWPCLAYLRTARGRPQLAATTCSACSQRCSRTGCRYSIARRRARSRSSPSRPWSRGCATSPVINADSASWSYGSKYSAALPQTQRCTAMSEASTGAPHAIASTVARSNPFRPAGADHRVRRGVERAQVDARHVDQVVHHALGHELPEQPDLVLAAPARVGDDDQPEARAASARRGRGTHQQAVVLARPRASRPP